MENTGKILFEDQSPQWFIALGKSWIGPLTAADVHGKVVRQEVSWAHYVWRKGQKNWQRICDTPPFEAAVPHEPSKAIREEVAERSRKVQVKKAAPPAPPKEDDVDQKVWYLYFNETQFGPFSLSEVEDNLTSGKIDSRVFVWRDGMTGWERLEKVEAFQTKLKGATSVVRPAALRSARAGAGLSTEASAKKTDKRGTPRKPMLARILLSNDRDVAVAVCRDISIGGMQVLTDKIPGDVGSRIKLNVSPAKDEKGKKAEFKPFVAEGTIVRMLEDGRGFSFRFSRLTESARRSIESYVDSK
ncbi:MAG: GYF domain-containing protein [Bdellovibrionia bacterium]